MSEPSIMQINTPGKTVIDEHHNDLTRLNIGKSCLSKSHSSIGSVGNNNPEDMNVDRSIIGNEENSEDDQKNIITELKNSSDGESIIKNLEKLGGSSGSWQIIPLVNLICLAMMKDDTIFYVDGKKKQESLDENKPQEEPQGKSKGEDEDESKDEDKAGLSNPGVNKSVIINNSFNTYSLTSLNDEDEESHSQEEKIEKINKEMMKLFEDKGLNVQDFKHFVIIEPQDAAFKPFSKALEKTNIKQQKVMAWNQLFDLNNKKNNLSSNSEPVGTGNIHRSPDDDGGQETPSSLSSTSQSGKDLLADIDDILKKNKQPPLEPPPPPPKLSESDEGSVDRAGLHKTPKWDVPKLKHLITTDSGLNGYGRASLLKKQVENQTNGAPTYSNNNWKTDGKGHWSQPESERVVLTEGGVHEQPHLISRANEQIRQNNGDNQRGDNLPPPGPSKSSPQKTSERKKDNSTVNGKKTKISKKRYRKQIDSSSAAIEPGTVQKLSKLFEPTGAAVKPKPGRVVAKLRKIFEPTGDS